MLLFFRQWLLDTKLFHVLKIDISTKKKIVKKNIVKKTGGGGLPVPTALRITDCVSSPCQVNQGEAITYAVDFVPTAASAAMTLAIESTVFGETREGNLFTYIFQLSKWFEEGT